FIVLMLLSVLTLIHINVEQLWHRINPKPKPTVPLDKQRVCLNRRHTGTPDENGRCPRCHTTLHLRRTFSLQKSWAALIASIIFLIPANLLPISEIWLNGARKGDTILS
ncbi:paraquat-inducible protein A, partial [Erwinia amylovora]|uniref:paraquat-inducible protein A n=1 Tax=Erwinia amylovora TaxID=552 RepID=UPI0020BF30AF